MAIRVGSKIWFRATDLTATVTQIYYSLLNECCYIEYGSVKSTAEELSKMWYTGDITVS